MGVVGRAEEQTRLSSVLAAASSGSAGVAVLVGDAGSGKTALLENAVASASGFTVIRARGSEAEASVAFGALLSLLRPHVSAIAELPEVPQSALLGALALGPPTPADRFAIGAATLQLLALFAERSPLLVAVDDLQWVDGASRDALLFALRRLYADRVAAVLVLRDSETADLRGFERIVVGGLPAEHIGELLAGESTRGAVAEAVALTLHRACEGNPLALLEAAASLSERQRRGLDALPVPLRIGAASVALYRPAIEALAPADRFGFLVAALSDDEADHRTVEDACGHAGFVAPSWAQAEAARLVTANPGGIVFAHPLARSAAVELASAADLRLAHGALGAVLPDGDRQVWHRSASLAAPDETVAAAMEAMAGAALTRGDPASALRAATRSAELSAGPVEAAPRHLLAAQCASLAGVDHSAHVRKAEASGIPAVISATAIIEASSAAWLGDMATTDRLRRDLLDDLIEQDRVAAAIVCAFSAVAAWNSFDVERAVAMAEKAWALADERLDLPHPFGIMPAIAKATHGLYTDSADGGPLDACKAVVEQFGIVDLATPIALGLLLTNRHIEAARMTEAMFDLAAQRGSVAAAAWLSTACGMCWHAIGELDRAYRWYLQGRELGTLVPGGYAWAQATAELSILAAQRGDFIESAGYSAEVEVLAQQTPIEPSRDLARLGVVLCNLFRGDVDDAVAELLAWRRIPSGTTEHFPVIYEAVEALVQLDRRDEALQLVPELERIGELTRLGHGGQVQRCLGMLATDGFEDHFEAALTLLDASPRKLELARTHLVYGERLLGVGRNEEAKAQLSAALRIFQAQGCRPWADRARSGLRLGGGAVSVVPAELALGERLTPQEQQVAYAVAEGQTNRQVAAALFVSSKTVEVHLTRVYRKLGVSSRTQLTNLLRRTERQAV